MAPVVGMDPLVDFGFLGMPQAEQGEQVEEEWGELDDYEEDQERVATVKLFTVNNWNLL